MFSRRIGENLAVQVPVMIPVMRVVGVTFAVFRFFFIVSVWLRHFVFFLRDFAFLLVSPLFLPRLSVFAFFCGRFVVRSVVPPLLFRLECIVCQQTVGRVFGCGVAVFSCVNPRQRGHVREPVGECGRVFRAREQSCTFCVYGRRHGRACSFSPSEYSRCGELTRGAFYRTWIASCLSTINSHRVSRLCF